MLCTNSTVLDKTGESKHPCIFPDIRERAFSLSPLSMMCTMDFYVWLLLCQSSFLITSLLSAFLMKGHGIFFKDFSVSVEMVMWGFFPPLLC